MSRIRCNNLVENFVSFLLKTLLTFYSQPSSRELMERNLGRVVQSWVKITQG